MKKIILFLLSYFLLGSFSVSANRYGAHSLPYTSPGGVTSCNQDGYGVAGICAQIGGLPAVGGAGACPHPGETGSGVAPTGNMTCLYWDQEIPTITDNYSPDGSRSSSGSKTITLTPVDTGGSGISTTKWCVGSTCDTSVGTVGISFVLTAPYDDVIRYQTWDVAGNASAIGTITVKLDASIPTVTDDYSPDGVWSASGSKTVTLTPEDTGGSLISTTMWCAGTSCIPSSNGTVGTTFTLTAPYDNTIRYQTWDVAGNASLIGTFIARLDTADPTVSDNYDPDGAWSASGSKNVILTPNDNGGSGISTTKWCIGTGCVPSDGTPGTTFTLNSQFDNTVRYQTWDMLGHTSLIGSFIAKLDNDAPSVSDNYSPKDTWSNSGSKTVTLAPVDTGLSGISVTRRCIGYTCNPSSGTGATVFTINADFYNTIKYQTWDNAGNASPIESFTGKLDKTPPNVGYTSIYEGGGSYSGIWTNRNVVVNITCNDGLLSGCDTTTDQYRVETSSFTCDDGSTNWLNLTGPITYNTTGERYVCFRSKDNAGNGYSYSSATSIPIKIDKISPTDLYDYEFDNIRKDFSTYTLTLSGSDEHSKIASIKWCEWDGCDPDGVTGNSGTVITKNSIYNNKIIYRIRDNAGNYTDSSFTLKLDGPIIYEAIKDNDSDGRVSINGYVTETGGLENVFWNNEISNNYIDDNSNNYDNAYTRIGDVNPGYVKLSVDKSSTIRVVKFDRARYNLNKELYVLESFEGTITGSQSGYIQKVGNSLNLNGTIGSAYAFNFTSSDYAIFIKNNGTGILNYKISGDTSTRGIYINPINDSYPEEIRILSSHIIIDSGVYIGKQTEYIKLK